MGLAAKPDYRALGRDKAWADAWARATEAQWRTFADAAQRHVSDVEGVRHFGAIKDEEAGFQAREYFSNVGREDPSIRLLLMQSAPLPVPYRVNGAFCATVL